MGNLILARAKFGAFSVVFKRDEALPVAGVCREQRTKYQEEWVALGQEKKSKMRPRPGSADPIRSFRSPSSTVFVRAWGAKATEEAHQEGVGKGKCWKGLGRMQSGHRGKDKVLLPHKEKRRKEESPVSFWTRHE